MNTQISQEKLRDMAYELLMANLGKSDTHISITEDDIRYTITEKAYKEITSYLDDFKTRHNLEHVNIWQRNLVTIVLFPKN